MLKTRNTISSAKISKRPSRPISAATSTSRRPKLSLQIHQIISSLEKNVKDLKTHYNCKQESRRITISNQKNKTGFRVGKVLHRNRSQSHFVKPQADKIDDRSIMDIFEIRSCFLKINGRETNNIVELYQFYKKNMEKREKSTRILASIDMSNPNMGISLEVGKESMLKHEHISHKEQNKREENQSSKIDQKLESSSRFSVSGKMNSSALQKGQKKIEKPSHLASELMSKNLYNFNNIANLMSNKKYKLTKDKEESFRVANQQRQKITSAKLHLSKQNNVNLINSLHQKTQNQMMMQIKQMKEAMISKNSAKLPSIQSENKKQIEEVSFQNKKQPEKQTTNFPQVEQQSEKKQKSNIKSFEVSSIKKEGFDIMRIQNIFELEQSPIVSTKTNNFVKSKYYVQPIPLFKKQKNIQQESLSLKSSSRIIDIQLLPFDL